MGLGKRGQSDSHYNPEKARAYRETFQERDPHGRTWKEHIADWKAEHPEYKERSNDYAKKSKRIAKLGLKKRLNRWGLDGKDIPSFLRLVCIEELDRVSFCIDYWEVLTGSAPRTPERLLETVYCDDGALLRRVVEQVTKQKGK